MVKRIYQLASSVADKIAAGEVVDRPLSVVKELLENAVDAGATNIAVEIQAGGKSYIRVSDNGCGIDPEDVETAFLRHATSKIRVAEDLEHIETLGFRGEALASIAAVSRVEIITRPEEARTGTRLVIEGGKVSLKEETGCPAGTTIIVRDLFYNTPARLKFMRRDTTESALIIDFVSKMALAYPDIRIRCINNGSILFSTQGKGDIYSNILTIFSKEIGEGLIPVRASEGDFSVEAYISPPDKSRSSRKHQIFFVNGRHIVSRVLERGVSDAYDQRLAEGRYPVVFLFLQVPPEFMDVNIHPNKREVRFHDEREVGTFITLALREALRGESALAPLFPGKRTEKRAMPAPVSISAKQSQQPLSHDSVVTAPLDRGASIPVQPIKSIPDKMVDDNNLLLKEEKTPYEPEPVKPAVPVVPSIPRAPEIQPKPAEPVAPIAAKTPEMPVKPTVTEHQTTFKELTESAENQAEKAKNRPFAIEDLQITGSIFATYITAVDQDHFYLIDQHAAHERIFYERLLSIAKAKDKDFQLLLTPLLKEVTPRAESLVEEWVPALRDLGFSIENFGERIYIIKEIPLFMTLSEADQFLADFLDNCEDPSLFKDEKGMDKIILRACKDAVKANDKLDPQEKKQLLKDLAAADNPFSCPHGRPIFLRLGKNDIERLFKR
ncbi:MAG: DNA mismatch repair endonuclease MutL [Firmicutes bacterium]|nr:DNA mismatch repair endonuclease MutL [Bacillota bacterium]